MDEITGSSLEQISLFSILTSPRALVRSMARTDSNDSTLNSGVSALLVVSIGRSCERMLA